MANGFALRGFTQGFTNGLQNVDALYNSYVNRGLKREEMDVQRQQQDRANRYNDYLIQEMERKNRREDEKFGLDKISVEQKQRQSQMELEDLERKREIDVLNTAIVTKHLDEKTLPLAEKYGLPQLAGIDPEEFRRAAKLVDGGMDPTDPQVRDTVNKVFIPASMRRLGSVGVVKKDDSVLDDKGEQITIATKSPSGLVAMPDGGWGLKLKVQGADLKGNYREYEAPYTKQGLSSPDDPAVRFNRADIVGKLNSGAWFNELLQSNPELADKMIGGLQKISTGVPKSVSPKEMAQIENYRDQSRSRQFQDRLKALQTEFDIATEKERAAMLRWQQESGKQKDELQKEYEKSRVEANAARVRLLDAKTATEGDKQSYLGARTGNAVYGRPGLGSARGGKSFSAKVDPKKVEMWFLNDIYNKDIGAANDPEVMKQLPVLKNQITNMVQLGEGQVSQDFAQTILYDAIKKDLQPMQKQFQGKTYRGYAYNGKFYPFAAE